MDFEPHFKVHNLVSVHPKNTNLNMIFHVVVSVYRLAKIWHSSQFLDEFQNGRLQVNVPVAIFFPSQTERFKTKTKPIGLIYE